MPPDSKAGYNIVEGQLFIAGEDSKNKGGGRARLFVLPYTVCRLPSLGLV